MTRRRAITLLFPAFALIFAGLAPPSALAQDTLVPRVALSFDDGFDPRIEPQAAAWNQAMLDALAHAGIHAILFPAGSRVDGPGGLTLVRAWGLAGHDVGNHTYRHVDFADRSISVKDFVADIERNQALLEGVPGWTPRLRFPYLKEGDTVAKRDGLRAWLAAHHYETGAVSIDTSDWYYDQRYRAWLALHPGADRTPFRQAYLAHLWDRAQYYDGLARRVLGRSASHVILLHTKRINADFLGDIIGMFRSRGWIIVPPAEAYQDPLYAEKPRVLPAGESILWSLAKQAGMPDLRYPAEDDVYEKPILDRLGF